jgi:hypothetical protein
MYVPEPIYKSFLCVVVHNEKTALGNCYITDLALYFKGHRRVGVCFSQKD